MGYIACHIMEYIDTMYFFAVEWGDRCSFCLKNGYKYQTQGGDNVTILPIENTISSYVSNAFPFISLNVGTTQHGQTLLRSHRQHVLHSEQAFLRGGLL